MIRWNFRPVASVLRKLDIDDPWKHRRFVDNRPDGLGGLRNKVAQSAQSNQHGGGKLSGAGAGGELAGLPTAGEREYRQHQINNQNQNQQGGGNSNDQQPTSVGWGEADLPPVLRNFLMQMTSEGAVIDPNLLNMFFL